MHTLQQTGDKFGITGERVRQIEDLKNRKKCAIHGRWDDGECRYCVELNTYRDFVKNLDRDSLMKEVAKQGENKKRDFVSVERKLYLIEILDKDYHTPFPEMVRLFRRDRTTVLHLYNKYLKKNHEN